MFAAIKSNNLKKYKIIRKQIGIVNGNLLWFVGSIFLNALGNSFMITANLGSAPWTAAAQNLASILPISLGICIIFLNFCSFLLSYIMKIKITLMTALRSMALTFVFGLFIDFFEHIQHMVYIPENFWVRCLYLIVGINLIAAAVCMYFQLGSLYLPFDYLLQAFGRLLKNYTVGTIICMSIPLSLSIVIFILHHHLSGLGLGTILFVFGIGFLIDYYNRLIVIHTVTETESETGKQG